MSVAAIGTGAPGMSYPVRKALSSPAPNDPAQEFLAFAKMTPAEKIRYLFLQRHGLSENDLKSMSPAKRAAIEAEIRDEIKDAMRRNTEKATGQIADLHA
jgi:hypothetical protein